MRKRIARLNHDIRYYEAINKRSRVTVVQNGEYIGYGDIIDFNSQTITIVDAEDGSRIHFIRGTCEFYTEIMC